MQITINNKTFECIDGSTVASVLELAGINAANIAVAMGSRIVPRTDWENTKVTDGAKLMVIKAVQGG